MKTNYINSVITKFFGNDMPKDIQARFQHWFLQPENMLEKEEVLHEIWSEIDVKADDTTRRKFVQLNTRIDVVQGKNKQYALKRVAAVAAVFLLLIGTSWLTWNLKDRQEAESFYIVEAPLGEKSKLTLPDGTIVWLNAGSQLTYSNYFNKNNRNVTLNGEGYFEVTKQGGKEFVVNSAGCGVHVKGTVFNVKAYREDPTVEVRLYEGSVCLSTPSIDEEDGIYMEPGEKVSYDKMTNAIKKDKLLHLDNLSWKDGYYHFTDNSLEEISAELERVFDVRIKIEDADIGQHKYHISFVNQETLPEMLDAINNDKKLVITYNRDTVEIRKRK